MEIPILTSSEDAKSVQTTQGKKEYPIKGKISWTSSKTPDQFAFYPDAGVNARWEAYIRSEVEGEKGKTVVVPNFPFAIIATGFKLSKVDTVNKEYWESSLAIDTRTDIITIWHNKAKIFEGSYAEAKAKFAGDATVKYKNVIIAVGLSKGNILEIEAGGLLVECFCLDAKTFLGKTVNKFALVTTPSLVFIPTLTTRRMTKEGKEFTQTTKGECFFLPVSKVGILPQGEMSDNVVTKKKEFEEWVAEMIKKIGTVEAPSPEEVAQQQRMEANKLAMEAQSPQQVVEKFQENFKITPPNPIVVPTDDFTNMDDSNQLPF